MPLPVPHELIEKIVARYERKAEARRLEPESTRPPRVITISRTYGSGGASVARLVGNRLGWHVWDEDILDVLADQSHGHYQARMFKSLDERAQGLVESLLSFCFGNADEDTYLYLLHKAMSIIAHHDAVIVGRGAYLALPQAFHVYLNASLGRRVKAIMSRLKLSENEALKAVKAKDHVRETFRKRFAARIKNLSCAACLLFDIELSTDRLPEESVAALICTAATEFFKG